MQYLIFCKQSGLIYDELRKLLKIPVHEELSPLILKGTKHFINRSFIPVFSRIINMTSMVNTLEVGHN
jgi:hypothetical protein